MPTSTHCSGERVPMTDAPLLFFHDTSVLVNFHRPSLIPALGNLLGPNVQWTASIRAECRRKEKELCLPPGLERAASEMLPQPISAEGGEHAALRQLRIQMAKPGDHPDEHLGEAETITIIQKRGLRAVFVTDDGDATKWAAPVPCAGTWKLLRMAYRRDVLTTAQAERLWDEFVGAGGHPPYYVSARRKLFDWLDAPAGS